MGCSRGRKGGGKTAPADRWPGIARSLSNKTAKGDKGLAALECQLWVAGEGEEEGRRLNPSFWVGIGVPPRDSYWQRGSSRHLLFLFPHFRGQVFPQQSDTPSSTTHSAYYDIGNWSQYTRTIQYTVAGPPCHFWIFPTF